MALAVLKRMLALVGLEGLCLLEGAGQQLDELGTGELTLRLVGRGGHAVDDTAVDEVVDVVVIPRILGDVRELRDVDAAHQRHRIADSLRGGLDADVVGRRARSGNLQLGQSEDATGDILNNELSFRKADLVIHINRGVHCLLFRVDLVRHRIAGQAAHADLNRSIRTRELHYNSLALLEINLILRANVDKVFINCNLRAARRLIVILLNEHRAADSSCILLIEDCINHVVANLVPVVSKCRNVRLCKNHIADLGSLHVGFAVPSICFLIAFALRASHTEAIDCQFLALNETDNNRIVIESHVIDRPARCVVAITRVLCNK